MTNREIVPPEPHSMGPSVEQAWSYIPRWLRVVIFAVFVAILLMTLVFIKN